MRTQLLCTFTNNRILSKTIDKVIDSYDVLYNKIFVLKNDASLRRIDTEVREIIYIRIKR